MGESIINIMITSYCLVWSYNWLCFLWPGDVTVDMSEGIIVGFILLSGFARSLPRKSRRNCMATIVPAYVGLGTSCCTAWKIGTTWWRKYFSLDLIGGCVVLVLHYILYDLINMMRAHPTAPASVLPTQIITPQRIACICSQWTPEFKFVVTFHHNDFSFNIGKLRLIAVRWAFKVSGCSTGDAKPEKIWTSPLPNICLGHKLIWRDSAPLKIHKVGKPLKSFSSSPCICFCLVIYLLGLW
jgi:hypothetical protein